MSRLVLLAFGGEGSVGLLRCPILGTYDSIRFKVWMRDPTSKNWDETRSNFQRESPTTQQSVVVVSEKMSRGSNS